MKTKIMLAILVGIAGIGSLGFAQTMDVQLSGVVTDYAGKPVREGFVMLEGSPRLCATTDGLGEFKISGQADTLPDRLLASWAGCETAEILITNAVMKGLVIRLKAEDRAFTKIEVGCAILASRAGANHKIHPLYEKLKDTTRKITEDEQVCVDAYQAFLKDKGEAFIKKILAGRELSADEAKYRYLLHAEISVRAGPGAFGADKEDDHETLAYARTVLRSGKKVIVKGCAGQPITTDDIEALRLYRAVQAVYAPATGQMHPTDIYYDNKGIPCIHYPDVGEKMIDFTFLDFDAMLKSPAYSDYSSLSLTEFLRLESLAEMFARFDSHDLDSDGVVIPAQPDALRSRYHHDYEKPVTTADILASGKPTLLSWICWEDRTFPAPNAWMTEYLRRAYGDKLQVVYLGAPSPLYGDMVIDEFRFFGPNPAAAPLKGLDTRLGEEDNTPERLARITKIACMENPVVSGRILMELPGEPYVAFAATGQKHDHITLLDAEGRTVSLGYYSFNSPTVTGGWWEESSFFGDYYHAFRRHPLLERLVRAFIANGGMYDKNLLDTELHPTYPTRQFAKHDVFVVRSIDAKKGILHAGWVKPLRRGTYGGIGQWPTEFKPEKEIDVRIKISPDTRIVMRMKDGKAWWPVHSEKMSPHDTPAGVVKQLVRLTDLKPGDRFWADIVIDEKQDVPRKHLSDRVTKEDRLRGFDLTDYLDKDLDAVRIQNFLDGRGRGGNAHYIMGSMMPLYGTIAKIDGTTVTVKIAKKDVVNMRGYQLWKQEEKNADPTVSEVDYARKSLPVIRRWAEGTDADRTYTFVVDRAVRITRNGQEDKTAADLKAGDYVYIAYHMWYETQHQGQCPIYPETIMASEPIQKMIP